MIINSVEAERIGRVSLVKNNQEKSNNFTVLTGPNGSGKTEILATIANVFHGAFHAEEACVRWTQNDQFRETTYISRPLTGRAHVVAQTFSPFSRFPSVLDSDPDHKSILSQFESPKDEYIGVGFASNATLNMKDFSRFIIENGILRLSEQPKAARAVFRLLQELGFKEGILLRYKTNRLFEVLRKIIAWQPHAIEKAFLGFRETSRLSIEGYGSFRTNRQLLIELRNRSSYEVVEFIRGAIGLIQQYADPEENILYDGKPRIYSFRTFQEHGMVSDFSVLQAFSILRRLGLLQLLSCQITPIGHKSIDVTLTSSGQQQLLCSFFGLAAALKDDAVVLIDEPELSLHPRWQLNFLRQIEHMLEAFSGCHVIIATHSPLIMQSAVSHGAFVVNLPLMPHVDQPKNREHISVEEALVDIFDTPLPNSLHISNEIFELISKAETGTLIDRMDSQRHLKAYLDLYRRDGEGSTKMMELLEKALRVIDSGSQFFRRPG